MCVGRHVAAGNGMLLRNMSSSSKVVINRKQGGSTPNTTSSENTMTLSIATYNSCLAYFAQTARK